MPELPEVEVVRRGLERYVVGRTVRSVQVFHPRAVRRHAAGPDDFAAALRGVTIAGARRRGKYIWLPVIAPGKALSSPAGAPAAQPGAAVQADSGEAGQEAIPEVAPRGGLSVPGNTALTSPAGVPAAQPGAAVQAGPGGAGQEATPAAASPADPSVPGGALTVPYGAPPAGRGAAIGANPGKTGAGVSLEDLAAGAGVSLEDLQAGAEVSLEDLEAGAEVSLEELGAAENAAGGGHGDGILRRPHENEPAASRGGSSAALRPGASSGDGPASAAEDALLAHLGMSGQLLLGDPARPLSPHVRVRFTFTDSGPDLRFTDQRTFGHLLFAPGGANLPGPISHIAPDPMEPAFDQAAFIAKLRTRRTGIKTALLDQSLVSGIGNIYADEALWRAKMHWARPAASLSRADAARLLSAVREVMADALAAGGTSFDSLYVNVNGESGYFGRSLAVYGREDQPCPRCGSPIRRDPFMNRSAYSCPVCQRRPRSRSGARDLRCRST